MVKKNNKANMMEVQFDPCLMRWDEGCIFNLIFKNLIGVKAVL